MCAFRTAFIRLCSQSPRQTNMVKTLLKYPELRNRFTLHTASSHVVYDLITARPLDILARERMRGFVEGVQAITFLVRPELEGYSKANGTKVMDKVAAAIWKQAPAAAPAAAPAPVAAPAAAPAPAPAPAPPPAPPPPLVILIF